MKKFKFLIFTLLLILPFSVKANVGLPHFHGYDAFVSNPNGAKLYKDDNFKDEVGILEYKSNLRVLYERVINEEIYVILDDDAVDYDYNYVLLKDITRTTNDYEITKTERDTYYAFKDINLYEGPSLSFEVIDTIPKGTEITLENSVDAIWWEYTYNGKKGYILCEDYFDSPRGLAPTNAKLYVSRDEKLLALKDITEGFTDPSNPTDENKINIKISKGTVLEFNSNDYIYPVLNEDYKIVTTDSYYYVTYNDKSAWISLDNFATDPGYDEYIISTENILTNKDYQNEKWSEKTMTRFHPYKVLYEAHHWYLIEIDGENYWVDRLRPSIKNFDYPKVNDVIEVEIKKSISLYDYDKTKIGTLEPGLYKVYNIVDSSWCFVEDNGYIKKSSVNFIEKTDTSTQTDEKFKKLDSMEIVLYCTAAAIVLAVISVVTIILIKKKKNKKLMTTESVENSLITEQTTEVSNDNNLQE